MIVNTYRAIIDKLNLHHCLKDSIFYFFVLINLLHLINKVAVKLSSFVTPCRAMEIRLGALLGLGEQCELGYYLCQTISMCCRACGKLIMRGVLPPKPGRPTA